MKRLLSHIIPWLTFYTYLCYNNKDYYPELSTEFYLFMQGSYVADLLILFYLNFFIAVPKFLIKKRSVFLYAIAVIVLIGINYSSSLLFGLILDVFSGTDPYYFSSKLGFSLHFLFTPILFIGLSIGARLGKQYYKDLYDKLELKQQLKQSELDALKAQINPHFLYNAFNSIYALAQMKSDKTTDAILQLSTIMRYVTYNAMLPEVSIKEELHFIATYIDFHKLRISNPEDKIISEITEPLENFTISPLILITFIENAFKHTNLVKCDHPIHIKFAPNKNGFVYTVTNQINNNEMTNSGVGLTNLKKILQFAYPNSHKIQISSSNGIYCAELTLDL